jgi:hypothetical protein
MKKISLLMLIFLLFVGIGVSSNVSINDNRINLALGQTVTSTSAYRDNVWKEEYLVDGDKMGSWPLPSGRTLGWRSAALPNRNTDVSVTITLGEKSYVDEVVLYPRGNGGICFPEDYRIEVSIDMKTWISVVDVTGDTRVVEEKRSHKFDAVEAKYIRIVMTRASEEKDGMEIAYELSEVEIWGRTENKLKLRKEEIWFSVGETETISPYYLDDTVETDYKFELLGDDVILVDEKGNIEAIRPGYTEVKVVNTITGDECICKVKVYKQKERNILITVPVWGNTKAITKEQFIALRDADVDIAMAVGHDMSQELTLRMLQVAKDIWSDELYNNLMVMIHSYTQGITPESTDDQIFEYVMEYKNTPALAGYHIEDEPFDPNPYARIERILKQNDPDCIADINFLPGLVYSSYDEYYNRMSDYSKLVGKYMSYLSFDNYPFGLQEGSVDETNLFGNFDVIRRVGLENDVPTTVYIQGVGSEHYGYRRPDENLLRYHIAASMAYGFKQIKYFSWFVPGADGTGESDLFMDAIMDKDFNKTELYYAVAKLNRQVHNVGNVLVNLDAVEVYHSGSKSNNSIYKKVTDSFVAQPVGDCYAILSLMIDKYSGEQYLIIVNKDFQNNQTMSFKLNNVDSVYELDKDNKGIRINMDYSNGVLTRDFLPGEFALIKLSDNTDHRSDVEEDDKNIFKGAYVRAEGSDTSASWSIHKVNDGTKLSTEKSMGWKQTSDIVSTHYLYFDLRDERQFNRIDIYPAGIGVASGNLFPESIAIYVSNDEVNWEKIYENNSIGRPTVEVPVLRFETISARFVKIEFPKTIGTAISEIEGYLDNGEIPLPNKTTYVKPNTRPDMNLAIDKPVRSSHSYNDAVWNPQNVVDGIVMASWPTDKTLGWHAGNYDTTDVEVWLQIDLEAYYVINRVVLYPRGNGGICFPKDYEIQVSENGIDWTTVYCMTNDENIGEKARIIDFDEISAKYVRLYVTKLSDDLDVGWHSCQISEFEVYNTNEYEDIPKTNDPKVTLILMLILVLLLIMVPLKYKKGA